MAWWQLKQQDVQERTATLLTLEVGSSQVGIIFFTCPT